MHMFEGRSAHLQRAAVTELRHCGGLQVLSGDIISTDAPTYGVVSGAHSTAVLLPEWFAGRNFSFGSQWEPQDMAFEGVCASRDEGTRCELELCRGSNGSGCARRTLCPDEHFTISALELQAAACTSAGGLIGSGTASDVCCDAMCGKCDGDQCTDLPGGAENCCATQIRDSGRQCTDEAAPCTLSLADPAVPLLGSASAPVVLAVRGTSAAHCGGVDQCADCDGRLCEPELTVSVPATAVGWFPVLPTSTEKQYGLAPSVLDVATGGGRGLRRRCTARLLAEWHKPGNEQRLAVHVFNYGVGRC
eukprot:SAG11_NODE_5652_length_1496_cov_1.239084_1_plen_305_part_00